MGKQNSISSDSELSFRSAAGGRKPNYKVRESQPNVGPKRFFTFEKQVGHLDKKLRKLGNEARVLGGSAGILSASTRLRERLGRVLHLFRQNAESLYPEAIHENARKRQNRVKPVRFWRTKNFLNHTMRDRKPHVQSSKDPKDPINLALEFRMFSGDVGTLFDCFSQFPEFVEELPDWSIAEELNEWADSLKNFEHEFTTLAVQKYMYDSMEDIGERLETLAEHFIPTFTKIGIPTVKASQDHYASNLSNQTVVATLFASIIPGMIQVFSDQSQGDGSLTTAILVLWYTGLIFCIASAVNGLLGLSWMRAIYRSPDHRVPWWVLIWIKRFPLIFLVMAIACSFAALILFALTPQQSRATLIIITLLSTLCCVGLVAVSGWFTCELVVFTRYEGRLWLADVVNNLTSNIAEFTGSSLSFIWMRGKELATTRPRKIDIEQVELGERPVIGFRTPVRVNTDVPFWLAHERDAMARSDRIRHRWHEAVRRVIEDQRDKTGRPAPYPSSRFAHLTSIAVSAILYNSVPKLQRMTISQSHQPNEGHTALVRSLQFSPDGKYLVTSSWDSRSFLFRIGSPVLCERVLTYPTNTGYIHQVDWSPDGKKLLARSTRKLIVWDLDMDAFDGTVRQATPVVEHQPDHHGHVIRGARWNGNGDPDLIYAKEFFSMQTKRVLTMNACNEILRDYATQHLELSRICVTSDSSWMICVGKALQDDKKTRQKYGIIVWDLKAHKVVKRVPVYYDMSDIALASDDRSVLVSYENKAPSQFWKLQVDQVGVDFVFRHSYMPKESTTFAALPSIFGGEHDHLVLRAASVGDICVWDRDSATFVHCITAPTNLHGSLTAFAWNRGSRRYMFATGTHDGTVQIWTPDAGPTNPEVQEEHEHESTSFADILTSEPTRLSLFSLRRASTGLDDRTLVSSGSSILD